MAEEIQFTDEVVYNGGINEADSPTKIKDNQWVEGENAEPLPDGVRMRRGYTNENSSVLVTMEESSTNGTDDRLFVDGTQEDIGQGFQVDADANFLGFDVRLKIGAGTPVVDLTAKLWNHAVGPNAAVATSTTTISASSLTHAYQWFRFNFASYPLTGSTQYYIVVGQYAAAAGNEAAIEENTAGGGYRSGNNSVWYRPFGGGAYTQVSAADLNFRIFTDTTSADVTAIHDYSLSDAATEYHLVLAGETLYKNVAGTFTEVSYPDGNLTSYTRNKDTHPSMVTANDRVLITEGTSPSKQFYVNSGTEYFENEGIAAPTTTPTLATGGAGDPVASGTWYVDYYFYNSRTGTSSPRRWEGVASASNDVITTGAEEIDITGLPSSAEGRAGDVATSIRLEVQQPSGSVFRTVADANGDPIDIAIGTTTYSITGTNTYTTLAEYDDDVPPQHSFKIVAENRQFVAGNTTFPWRIYYSKLSGGVPYYESFPSTNFRDFGRGDGDYVTAFAFMAPRTLVVGFKNSIWAIDARNPGVSDRMRIANGVGIANHLSLVVVGDTIYFVSDADKQKGMFRWRAGMPEPELLTGIDDTFQNLNHARLDNCSCLFYAPDDNRHQWWTTLSGSAQSDQSKILVYDVELDAWTDYDIAANVIGLVEEGSVLEVFLGRSGYESKADSGTDDDGTTISAFFKTKAYNYGLFGVRKKLRFIDYIAAQKSSGSLNVLVEADLGGTTGNSTNLDFPSEGTSFVWGTSKWGDTGAGGDGHVWGGGTGDVSDRRAVRCLGRLLGYEYSSQSDFHLKTISYGIQKTGRR